MHYFIYGSHIAAVEDATQAAKYAAAGWREVSRETFMDAWKRRDARDLAAIRSEVEMVVVETAPLRDWTPAGYMRYQV